MGSTRSSKNKSEKVRMKVAVIGGTGLVGTEMISIMSERNFPVSELVVFASTRSEGKKISTPFGEVTCRVARDVNDFDCCDFVIVDVEDDIALELVPLAIEAGAKIVDNSAAFRMDKDVPLVVSEVNPQAIKEAKKSIVACPNCTTMILLTALGPLHEEFQIDRMVISSYQSVSGAGQAGMDELRDQWRQRGFDDDLDSLRTSVNYESVRQGGGVWDKAIAGNVIPLAGSVRESGYTSEEEKLVYETHKILGDETIRVTATCVRVPVFVGHALSVNVSFKNDVDAKRAAKILADAPGVVLDTSVDIAKTYPTPLDIAGSDPVHVGRIRDDKTQPNTLDLWVTGDNLRKGAALNAVQIAELWTS